MKKVIGLCLVILMSSVSVFAQKGKQCGKKCNDSAQCCEQMISDLNLNEKQTAEFRKIEAEYKAKMTAEQEKAKSDRKEMREKMKAMREERNAELKKILTEDQYKQFIAKQHSQSPRKGDNRKK